MDIQNKVVWITGASSGIGEALAYEFHRRGARLILSSNEEEELNRVKANCRDDERVTVFPLDLAELDTLEAKAKAAVQQFGPVDILVNNAGISQRSLVKDTALSTYQKILNIDFLGQVVITRAVLPGMLERKSGQIVVMSSITGKIGAPMRSGYCAAKHALHGFFDTLRAEVWRENIQVTIICPTAVKTRISFNAVTGDGRKYGEMSDHLEQGLTAPEAAREIIAAMAKGQEEIILGRDRLRYSVYLKRFFPGLFSKVLRKAKVN